MSNYQYQSQSKKLNSKLKREIGFQLFCHRHKHKIRSSEVCKALNLSPKKLDELEIGRRKLDLQNIKKILDFYDLDIKMWLGN